MHRNEVDIPEDLRHALLGEEIVSEIQSDQSEKHEQHSLLDSLVSQRAHELADLDDNDLMQSIRRNWGKLSNPHKFECRVVDGSYTVKLRREVDTPNGGDEDDPEAQRRKRRVKQHISTVVTASPLHALFTRLYKAITTGGQPQFVEEARDIMSGVHLKLETGKMYLVLGAPGSGKSTLLKMIANTLKQNKTCTLGGKVSINGISPTDKEVVWTNLSAHIDQIDRLHPYLTVWETCQFAWECRNAGTHAKPWHNLTDPEVVRLVRQMDEEYWLIQKILDGMGLTRVKDTFVGDNTSVRGVSG